MAPVDTIVLRSRGVVLVESPRYLAYPLLDRIDDLMERGVSDEARFWDEMRVRFDLAPEEIPRIQGWLAEKYRRELNLWSALPRLRRGHRLVVFDTGSPAVWSLLRSANGLDGAFDALVNAAEEGLPASGGRAYPALVSHLGLEPERCLVVDTEPRRLEPAAEAGCRTHRYRTPKSLREALVTS